MFYKLPNEIIDNILFVSGDNKLISTFGSKYIKYKWYIHITKYKISNKLNNKFSRYYAGLHQDYYHYYVTNDNTFISIIKDEYPSSVFIYKYNGKNQYSNYIGYDGRKWKHNDKEHIHDTLSPERKRLFEEIKLIR